MCTLIHNVDILGKMFLKRSSSCVCQISLNDTLHMKFSEFHLFHNFCEI